VLKNPSRRQAHRFGPMPSLRKLALGAQLALRFRASASGRIGAPGSVRGSSTPLYVSDRVEHTLGRARQADQTEVDEIV
jgi:hypothetical protein